MNEFFEMEDIDDSCEDCLQFDCAEMQEADELRDENDESPDVGLALTEKSRNISQLDHQYEQAKESIVISRTQEEMDYWVKRSDEIWCQRDKESADYWQFRSKISK